MPALNTDKARKAAPLFATQLSGSIASTDTTIPLQSVAGLPLDTAVTLTIDATDANGNLTPTFKETVTGVVNTGTTSLVSCVRGLDNTTAQAHSTGANTVQWFTANDWNDFIASYLTGHTQLGYHQALSDVNGNAWIGQSAVSSAVNQITIGNAITGTNPTFSVTGSDSSIGGTFSVKGSGVWQGLIEHVKNPYKFSAYRNGAWTTGTGSYSKVQFDTVIYDTSSNFDAVTNFRFTAPINGFYHFDAVANFQTISGTGVAIRLYKNGVGIKDGDAGVPVGYTGPFPTGLSVSDDLQLNATDYVEVFLLGNGAAGLTGTSTQFSGHLISNA